MLLLSFTHRDGGWEGREICLRDEVGRKRLTTGLAHLLLVRVACVRLPGCLWCVCMVDGMSAFVIYVSERMEA